MAKNRKNVNGFSSRGPRVVPSSNSSRNSGKAPMEPVQMPSMWKIQREIQDLSSSDRSCVMMSALCSLSASSEPAYFVEGQESTRTGEDCPAGWKKTQGGEENISCAPTNDEEEEGKRTKTTARERTPLDMVFRTDYELRKNLKHGLSGGNSWDASQSLTTTKSGESKRKPKDRALKCTGGHFRGGVLNVKHLLQPNSPSREGGDNTIPTAYNRKGKKGKGGGKKKGKGSC
ncbi:hypothetical protein CDL15_Pgr026653 [Punica granatum]|uniref:Uncharacterized protein n=1 Tax=Punica granatum TaxID=22663 RepID=A0A218WL46_PUNGR|nr:hypothetical protein CDL15_Pgr026653 [Punica granatum]